MPVGRPHKLHWNYTEQVRLLARRVQVLCSYHMNSINRPLCTAQTNYMMSLCLTYLSSLLSKVSNANKQQPDLDYSCWHELTFKAFRDWEGPIIAGAGHRIAALLVSVQTKKDDNFSMQNPVWFQVLNPDFSGIVEDTTPFYANCAGS